MREDDLDGGRMHWFGPPWDSWICSECPQVPIPVGEACLWCAEPIGPQERGVTQLYLSHDDAPQRRPYHVECLIRSAAGGLNHQMGRCTCCGGAAPPDPPHLSRREAARAAAAWAWLHGDDPDRGPAQDGVGP